MTRAVYNYIVFCYFDILLHDYAAKQTKKQPTKSTRFNLAHSQKLVLGVNMHIYTYIQPYVHKCSVCLHVQYSRMRDQSRHHTQTPLQILENLATRARVQTCPYYTTFTNSIHRARARVHRTIFGCTQILYTHVCKSLYNIYTYTHLYGQEMRRSLRVYMYIVRIHSHARLCEDSSCVRCCVCCVLCVRMCCAAAAYTHVCAEN